MDVQQKIRDERYANASPELQELYANGEVGMGIRMTFDALGIPAEKYYAYVHIFGDAFLGIETPDSIAKKLSTHFALSEPVAQSVVQKIATLIPSSVFVIPGTVQTPAAATPPEQTPVPSTLSPSVPDFVASTVPTPHIPAARVMPRDPAVETAAQPHHDPRASTELPNALLQNLKASLMHSAPEEPLEGTVARPSYNTLLTNDSPTPPTAPRTP